MDYDNCSLPAAPYHHLSLTIYFPRTSCVARMVPEDYIGRSFISYRVKLTSGGEREVNADQKSQVIVLSRRHSPRPRLFEPDLALHSCHLSTELQHHESQQPSQTCSSFFRNECPKTLDSRSKQIYPGERPSIFILCRSLTSVQAPQRASRLHLRIRLLRTSFDRH